jgi:prostaglandin-H2 D-isomerase / glutathione transferase
VGIVGHRPAFAGIASLPRYSGAMPAYKLTYFDGSVSRGEECRLALHVAGVDFVDNRIQSAQWPDLKPKTPFGSVPVLEVEGKGQLAQSNAILAYVGRAHGLHPSDAWEAAQHEAIMAAVEELRHRIAPSLTMKDPDEKKRTREELARGYMQSWGASVEKQLGDGPFVAGERIQVADIKLYVVMNWFVKGALDHVPADVFGKYTRLTRLFDAVKKHPRVVDWQTRHP